MDAQDNKQLALQKAISSHEQAAAALNDLMSGIDKQTYTELLDRIEQNLTALRSKVESSRPGDRV